MIRCITEHKDLRVRRVDDAAGPGPRWGVEAIYNVLTERGIKISSATNYEGMPY